MKSPWVLALALVCLGPVAARGHIGDSVAQLRGVYGATGKLAGRYVAECCLLDIVGH